MHNFLDLQKCLKNYENFQKLQNLSKKYQFLYEQPWWSRETLNVTQNLYMIHKIEIFPHYTYPTVPPTNNTNNNQGLGKYLNNNDDEDYEHHYHNNEANIIRMLSQNLLMPKNIRLDSENSNNCITNHLLQPYRTVSHYGFNYPSTYMPSIALHPACSITAVDLQRQKVIAFIKRLNLEAQAVEQQMEISTKLPMKLANVLVTGKEDEEEDVVENIYENTKNLNDLSLDNTGSFISVKEIQLNTSKERRASILSDSKSTDNQQRHHHHQGDLQSEQFSSMLSISGTYPNATHSHSGDVDHDHFLTDSGDNCSNFDLNSRKTNTHNNLYRSYVQRNFIPLTTDSNHSIGDLHENDHDPHKPESEQQQSQNITHEAKLIQSFDDNKHVTLTLNSLKRRASSLNGKKEKSRSIRSKSATNKSTLNSYGGQLSDAHSLSESSSAASTAIEIHININIRNSDCVKNLQNREQEFKSKLEKVIDNEINLITQELATTPQSTREACEEDSTLHLNLISQRCLSAPDSISFYGRDPSCIEADRHLLYNFSDSAATTPVPLPPPNTAIHLTGSCEEQKIASSLPQQQQQHNLYTLRYRHTLAMLEHELEMLLNGIIRNMCDCKSKLTQISEDIRTATLHVGSLNPSNTKRKKRHIFNHE